MKYLQQVPALFRVMPLPGGTGRLWPFRSPSPDSVAMATQVEEALADDPALIGAQVDVEVVADVVELTGFVDYAFQMNRAVTVASAVPGVSVVRNSMNLAWW